MDQPVSGGAGKAASVPGQPCSGQRASVSPYSPWKPTCLKAWDALAAGGPRLGGVRNDLAWEGVSGAVQSDSRGCVVLVVKAPRHPEPHLTAPASRDGGELALPGLAGPGHMTAAVARAAGKVVVKATSVGRGRLQYGKFPERGKGFRRRRSVQERCTVSRGALVRPSPASSLRRLQNPRPVLLSHAPTRLTSEGHVSPGGAFPLCVFPGIRSSFSLRSHQHYMQAFFRVINFSFAT